MANAQDQPTVSDYLKEDKSPIWYSGSGPTERRIVVATAVALGFQRLREFEEEFKDANDETYKYKSLNMALCIWKARYGTKMARKRSLESLVEYTINTVQRISKKEWTDEMIYSFTMLVHAMS